MTAIAKQFVQNAGVLRLPNQPGGYVSINSSGDVIGTFAQRRDTAANIASIVLANGELAFTTDTQEIFVGDGTTAGGLFVSQPTQIKSKFYTSTSLVSAPGYGLATDSTSILFKKSLGGLYRVCVNAYFAGDTGNTSNFGINFNIQAINEALVDSEKKSILKHDWYDISTFKLIESNCTFGNYNAGALGLPLNLSSSNLTESSAFMRAEIDVKLSTSPADFLNANMAITATNRSGDSLATCLLYATCQRVA